MKYSITEFKYIIHDFTYVSARHILGLHDVRVFPLSPQAEKDATEIKRLRGLNDTLEKELEKLRGELESGHTRRKLDKVRKVIVFGFSFSLFMRSGIVA